MVRASCLLPPGEVATLHLRVGLSPNAICALYFSRNPGEVRWLWEVLAEWGGRAGRLPSPAWAVGSTARPARALEGGRLATLQHCSSRDRIAIAGPGARGKARGLTNDATSRPPAPTPPRGARPRPHHVRGVHLRGVRARARGRPRALSGAGLRAVHPMSGAPWTGGPGRPPPGTGWPGLAGWLDGWVLLGRDSGGQPDAPLNLRRRTQTGVGPPRSSRSGGPSSAPSGGWSAARSLRSRRSGAGR